MSTSVSNTFAPLSNPNKDALEYPFSFIADKDVKSVYNDYKPADFSRGFADEEPIDVSDFPKNIVEYYWISEGENDGDSWECLCKLTGDIYAYYTASCDYTGFDCQGGMWLFVSKNKERILNESMTSRARAQYYEFLRAQK